MQLKLNRSFFDETNFSISSHVFFSAIFSLQAAAADETTQDSPLNKSGLKLLSGVANIATGWIEIPKNINLVGQQQNVPAPGAAIIGQGVFQGIWHTLNRTGCGVFDLVTFMFPANPSVDPVFVWDDFLKESRFMGPR
ncbi:MAG: exosortase system-associated protein, TIGR04073 family [Pseudomonadota bacterium]